MNTQSQNNNSIKLLLDWGKSHNLNSDILFSKDALIAFCYLLKIHNQKEAKEYNQILYSMHNTNVDLLTPQDIQKSLVSIYLYKLKRDGKKIASLKNYISDINQFIRWANYSLDDYRHASAVYFKHIKNKFKQSTVDRKAHSISSFLDFIAIKKAESSKQIITSKKIIQKRSLLFTSFSFSLLLVTLFALNQPSLEITSNQQKVPQNVSMSSKPIQLNDDAQIVISVSAPPFTDQKADLHEIQVNPVTFTSISNESEVAGTSSIPPYKMSTTIYSTQITRDSLLFITPTTSQGDSLLYIEKIGDGYAVIAVEKESVEGINFNWFVYAPKSNNFML